MYSHLMFAIAVLLTALAISPMIGQGPDRQQGLAAAHSENFMVYRGAVREYMMNNPGHTGTISESDLDLPRTFNNMGWNNRANAGTAWIYGDMAPGGLRKVVDAMDNPVNVGQKDSGWLVSPVHGDTGIAVPGHVAEGQVAAVVQNT